MRVTRSSTRAWATAALAGVVPGRINIYPCHYDKHMRALKLHTHVLESPQRTGKEVAPQEIVARLRKVHAVHTKRNAHALHTSMLMLVDV